MKYMAIIDADEKPISCEFIGCNGNVAPYLIGATTNIKPLEQEPILDKIRAEVEVLYDSIDTVSHNEYENAYDQGKERAYEFVLDIIDKYKTESEE